MTIIPVGMGNISFLQKSDTGCIKHTPGQVSCSGAVGQHIFHSVFIVAFLFCFGVRGEEHGVGMIEKMGGFGRIQKTDKNIKNYIV